MGECEREHCEVHPQEGASSEWRALRSALDSRNRTWSCVPAADQSEPDGESEQGGTEHRQGGGFRDRGGQFEDGGAACTRDAVTNAGDRVRAGRKNKRPATVPEARYAGGDVITTGDGEVVGISRGEA
jgi:hypothetical protein